MNYEEVLEEDAIQNWMFSTLSVNSILSLEETDDKYVYDKGFDPIGWFRKIRGVS